MRISRRTLLGAAPALALADVPPHRWDGYDFGPGPAVTNRLNQGPFGIDQDEGWFTIAATTPSEGHIRNWGLGLVGYTWEESGPSLAARRGAETLEQHVEKISSLPFVDILYIRCDWRDVQSRPGRLDLHPIWKLTLDAARQRGLRVGFRVQLSNPEIQPAKIAMPDFLRDRVPLAKIGKLERGGREFDALEPRYDHPEFQKAFRELNELLAAELDSNPLIEWMDLMQYGFWGESHTSDLPNPFHDYLTAEKTFVAMTRLQLETWRRTPLAVNTEPDISNVGNREVIDLAVRAGCWLRSDSVLVEEPIQIEELSNRPAWLPVVMEDGYNRDYNVDTIAVDAAGINLRENCMQHVLDMGGNYWSLWTEAGNLARYHERYPNAFPAFQRRMGYRVRPAWIWQRKRYGTAEIIVGFANNGVAGIPGVLRVTAESPDGKFRSSGSLDAGQPYAGKVRQASFILPSGIDGQKLILRGEIEAKAGVRHPIRWSCAQPLNPDGSLTIQLKSNSDKDWRKGV
ncbi:MAG: hypothetical protein LAP39_21860 [Acidobacteriia bacterium]|nr:hypothetical protein [Terriglobia bacterium]